MRLNLNCKALDEITGIILAGGKCNRMGKDKAFLSLSDRAMVEIVIERLKPLFYQLLVVTHSPQLYKKYNITAIKDILPNRGPLGGIYTGLLFSNSEYNFIVACDMPFLNPGLVRYMIEKIDNYEVVVAEYQGRLQPLCAIYSKTCIQPIKNQLSKDSLKIINFFKEVKVRLITESEVLRFDPQGLSFVNINTVQEYRRYKKVASRQC